MEKADIAICNCTILPLNRQGLIEKGTIAIKDKRIAFVGKQPSTLTIQAEIKINAKGKIAMPGLVNCHTHVPMTLFRGVAEDQPLNTWLRETIWPLEEKLKPEDVYHGALLGCLEMIKSGTTCFSDMYFQENMVAEATKASGLRAVLAEGIIENADAAAGEEMLRRSVDFAEHFNGYASGRVSVMLGPHAVYSCSPELLARVHKEASRLKAGVHMHLAESKALSSKLKREHRLSEVELLDKCNVLDHKTLAAHCIDLSESDMRILASRRINVAYVPVANMKLGLGIARIRNLAGLGINVGFGTDGPASNNVLDMFETMKIGAILQKSARQDPTVLSVHETLQMATRRGAVALGLENSVGSLEVGKKADVILLDFLKPHLTPLHNVGASVVYSCRGSDVDTVIVDGQILMQNRQVKTLDEETVMAKAGNAALNLLSANS